MPLRTRCGTSRLPCMSLGVRAQGLGPRGGGTALAITICSVLPSVPYDAVGPPKFILLSRLNIQPARLPVNASPLLSRTTTHDSGPIWFATPSLGGTCTRETYRFVPAHREVKILMRLPDAGRSSILTGRGPVLCQNSASRHRRKNCASRNQAKTLAREQVTRQPPTLDCGSTHRCIGCVTFIIIIGTLSISGGTVRRSGLLVRLHRCPPP